MNDHTSPVGQTQPNLAFVTGCGRSGTTILGNLLAQHPDIRYLNDRFSLWVDSFALTDIWGKGHGADRPKIRLTAEDAEDRYARSKLVAQLDAERRGKPLLIEKMAINNCSITSSCPMITLPSSLRMAEWACFKSSIACMSSWLRS
ncbi:MAG: sulfotransferase [Planctomycetes bacterium]|nr:sulfotransferase [Planctomycetota bacterium]